MTRTRTEKLEREQRAAEALRRRIRVAIRDCDATPAARPEDGHAALAVFKQAVEDALADTAQAQGGAMKPRRINTKTLAALVALRNRVMAQSTQPRWGSEWTEIELLAQAAYGSPWRTAKRSAR